MFLLCHASCIPFPPTQKACLVQLFVFRAGHPCAHLIEDFQSKRKYNSYEFEYDKSNDINLSLAHYRQEVTEWDNITARSQKLYQKNIFIIVVIFVLQSYKINLSKIHA